jgi:hypothetical protein
VFPANPLEIWLVLDSDVPDETAVRLNQIYIEKEQVSDDVWSPANRNIWKKFTKGGSVVAKVEVDFNLDGKTNSRLVFDICDPICRSVEISGYFFARRNVDYGFRVFWNIMGV